MTKKIELEIIYIDDSFAGGTAAEVRRQDERVRMVSFSSNFDQEAAMYAGLENVKGDYVVMMDVDLQVPPTLLPEMISHMEQDYDSVATRRVIRKGNHLSGVSLRGYFAAL